MSKQRIELKLVIIGPVKVGKSSLVTRWTGKPFIEEYKPTLVSNFGFKIIYRGDRPYRVQVWDLTGQDRSCTIAKDAQGIICVADATDNQTLRDILQWKKVAENECQFVDHKPVPNLLVENKSDLLSEEERNNNVDLDFFAKKNSFDDAIKTSAKTGFNIEKAFDLIIDKMIKRLIDFLLKSVGGKRRKTERKEKEEREEHKLQVQKEALKYECALDNKINNLLFSKPSSVSKLTNSQKDICSSVKKENQPFQDIKIIIIGPVKVGKSSLVTRWTGKPFIEEYKPTLVTEFGCKIIYRGDQPYRVQVWDLTGWDRNCTITKILGKDARGIICVSDVTDKLTLRDLLQWKKVAENEFQFVDHKPVPNLLVENKADLLSEEEEGNDNTSLNAFAKENHFYNAIQTSAKTGVNIDKAFDLIIDKIIKQLSKKLLSQKNKTEKIPISDEEVNNTSEDLRSSNSESDYDFSRGFYQSWKEDSSSCSRLSSGASSENSSSLEEKQPSVQLLNEIKKLVDLKLIIIGPVRVGKSSLVLRWTNKPFKEYYKATIVTEYGFKMIFNNDLRYRIVLEDVPGLDKNSKISKILAKEAHGIIFVTNATEKQTFEDVLLSKKAVESASQFFDGKPLPNLLVMNKADLLSEEEKNDNTELNSFAKENGFDDAIKTSAKTGLNIDEALYLIFDRIIKRYINYKEYEEEKERKERAQREEDAIQAMQTKLKHVFNRDKLKNKSKSDDSSNLGDILNQKPEKEEKTKFKWSQFRIDFNVNALDQDSDVDVSQQILPGIIYKAIIKIIVAGKAFSGKTSIIERWAANTFTQEEKYTERLEHREKIIQRQGEFYLIQLWDINRIKKDKRSLRQFRKNALGLIVCIAEGKDKSLEKALKEKRRVDKVVWFPDERPLPCILLQNKADLLSEEERNDCNSLNEFSQMNHYDGTFKTSAANGFNIDRAFDALIDNIIKRKDDYNKKDNDGKSIGFE